MTRDPFDFVYDKSLRDKENDIAISVTVVDQDPDCGVQIRLKSGALDIPFFLTFRHARTLTKLLAEACDAAEAAVAKSSETTAE